jgi:hypothetical protein
MRTAVRVAILSLFLIPFNVQACEPQFFGGHFFNGGGFFPQQNSGFQPTFQRGGFFPQQSGGFQPGFVPTFQPSFQQGFTPTFQPSFSQSTVIPNSPFVLPSTQITPVPPTVIPSYGEDIPAERRVIPAVRPREVKPQEVPNRPVEKQGVKRENKKDVKERPKVVQPQAEDVPLPPGSSSLRSRPISSPPRPMYYAPLPVIYYGTPYYR